VYDSDIETILCVCAIPGGSGRGGRPHGAPGACGPAPRVPARPPAARLDFALRYRHDKGVVHRTPPRAGRLPPNLLRQEPTVTDRVLALSLAAAAVLAVSRVAPADDAGKKPASVYDFKVQDIDGKDVNLSKYQGKVLLIVNTASQCGNTPQYEGLEAIYQKYKDRGFEVLAFPANEFGHQEPGTNSEIKAFCTSTYHTSFPLFSKIVVKGNGIHPLYQFLTSKETDPKFGGDVTWNFAKFLVNRKGEVVARFEPGAKPETKQVTGAIESALAQPK
jgi:glutathione peroxidase